MGRAKIFGIGKPKTGSNSLTDALKRLGYSVYHSGRDVDDGNCKVNSQLMKNLREGCEALKGIPDDYDALLDYPIQKQFKKIYKEVPDAKFILTFRPPDDVAFSWLRMINYKSRPINPYFPTNFKEFADEVRNHFTEVFHFFLDKPGSLLILDTRDPDETKWKLLCDFLGEELPEDISYPHSFDHKQWETTKRKLGENE